MLIVLSRKPQKLRTTCRYLPPPKRQRQSAKPALPAKSRVRLPGVTRSRPIATRKRGTIGMVFRAALMSLSAGRRADGAVFDCLHNVRTRHKLSQIWIDPSAPGVRTRSSTNSRIAEDKLACSRVLSISVTIFDNVACWARAISFRPLQNASSRLTLVLCPSITTERLTTEDFMGVSPIVCSSR